LRQLRTDSAHFRDKCIGILDEDGFTNFKMEIYLT